MAWLLLAGQQCVIDTSLRICVVHYVISLAGGSIQDIPWECRVLYGKKITHRNPLNVVN